MSKGPALAVDDPAGTVQIASSAVIIGSARLRDVAAVGRPGGTVAAASAAARERLGGRRNGDLSLPPPSLADINPTPEANAMGHLYSYRGIVPSIAASAVLFPTAEITGDVVVG